MIRKEDVAVGRRIKWQSADARFPVTYGIIRQVDETNGKVVVEWLDGEDGLVIMDAECPFYVA